ncbi:MAG TPA: aromatic ring-opening dioxygenase subunit LigA, partial [Gammaproteobacteria bacterium]|nr:aromatic ring-opening dioxygenase subunit LigA [Gammaproteobacteria bacterium]
MSLYQVQKLLYNLNRDEQFKAQYTNDKVTLLGSYDLTDQEREALS